jgi:hypothetical protein
MEDIFMNINEALSISVDEDYGESQEILPEKKLMTAVLERAILDLKNPDPEVREDAASWFNSPDEPNPCLFSYRHLCLALDLDQDKFRQKVFSEKPSLRRPRTTPVSSERSS